MVNKAETRENDTDGNPLDIQIEVSKVAIWCYLRIYNRRWKRMDIPNVELDYVET